MTSVHCFLSAIVFAHFSFSITAVQFGHPPAKSETVLTSSARSAQAKRKYTQNLTNVGDVLYTSSVKVGMQTLKAVVDTGSFDQVVLSTECMHCGNSDDLYRHKPFANADSRVDGIVSYGSGVVYTTEVVDHFSVGPLEISNLSFWAVTNAEMYLLEMDAFQVIFGIGPPVGGRRFVRKEVRSVHQTARDYEAKAGILPPEVQDLVARYEGALVHDERRKGFVSASGISSVSACFFKSSGSGGLIIWNDDALEEYHGHFDTISVVGDFFWSAKVKDVLFDRVVNSVDGSPFRKKVELGCSNRCDAILDTGSSLIAAPSGVVAAIYAVFEEWAASGGDCDDLSKLPDLKFTLGHVKLALPAESYVGKLYGELTGDMKKFMPKLAREKRTVSADGSRCEVILVETTDDSWVLGMPFFRKYYTAFTYSGDSASAMSFSIANSECMPGASPSSVDLKTETASSAPLQSTLNIDAANIRLPGSVALKRFL